MIEYYTESSKRIYNIHIETNNYKYYRIIKEFVRMFIDHKLDFINNDGGKNTKPTVDTEPVKHGEWLEYGEPTYKRCSSCGKRLSPALGIFPQYCPNCGAKMDGEEQ